MARLTRDKWREGKPFTPEIREINVRILDASDEIRSSEALRSWLEKYQPCLFGRIAAKLDLLTFCILSAQDLQQSDEYIREKIQACRSEWTRLAFEGKKSGFIILAAAPEIVNAEPNSDLMNLAQHLCQLYLLEDVEPNKIYLDEVFLEKPGKARTTWKWLAGVNVFASSADQRWWHDHRIPGGLAFSVNSVGHLVKSTILAGLLEDMNQLLGDDTEDLVATKVDSLEKALEFAMRTIHLSTETEWGKAVDLLPLPSNPDALPASKCPVELPEFLRQKNYCYYSGYYHTDVTIPSDYFDPHPDPPNHVVRRQLDFTYLFHDKVDNPSHLTMGRGRIVRGGTTRYRKSEFGDAKSVRTQTAERLSNSLRPQLSNNEPSLRQQPSNNEPAQQSNE